MNTSFPYQLNFISTCKLAFVWVGLFFCVGLSASTNLDVDSTANSTIISGKIFVKSGTLIANSDQIKGAELVWVKDEIKKTKTLKSNQKNSKEVEKQTVTNVAEETPSEPVLVYRSVPSPFSLFCYSPVQINAITTNSKTSRTFKINLPEKNIFLAHTSNLSDSSETNNPYFLYTTYNGLSAYSWKSRPPPSLL